MHFNIDCFLSLGIVGLTSDFSFIFKREINDNRIIGTICISWSDSMKKQLCKREKLISQDNWCYIMRKSFGEENCQENREWNECELFLPYRVHSQ